MDRDDSKNTDVGTVSLYVIWINMPCYMYFRYMAFNTLEKKIVHVRVKKFMGILYCNGNKCDNTLEHFIFVHIRLPLFSYLNQFSYLEQITVWYVRLQDFANI